VILGNGKDSVSYDKLILAPGGTPRRLLVEGVQLQNVYTFRTIDDAKKVDAGMFLFLSLKDDPCNVSITSGKGG
jgi:NADPH-dependent 2,4-dienoyl-CoA reductase/sulfur reductase-like enzyme